MRRACGGKRSQRQKESSVSPPPEVADEDDATVAAFVRLCGVEPCAEKA